MDFSQVITQLNTHQQAIQSLMIQAGAAVMDIYNSPDSIDVRIKGDTSPLTAADLASHDILSRGLASIHAPWPILSEESEAIDPETRMAWPIFWLVDPLDGTKEFIKLSDEFTLNIALIFENKPIAGWVYAPAMNELYEAIGETATLIKNQQTTQIQTRTIKTPPKLLASRRHGTDLMKKALVEFEALYGPCETVSRGSSLKICELAAGRADFYPRLGPTHEWDTAAAHAVLKAAGGDVLNLKNQSLAYNQRTDTLNPYFIAVADLGSTQHTQLIETLNQLCAEK